MGADTSQRSRRAETRPQMRTQAEMTANVVMLRSWFMGRVPLSSVGVPPGQIRRSRPRPCRGQALGWRSGGTARPAARSGGATRVIPASDQVQGLNIAGRVLADH